MLKKREYTVFDLIRLAFLVAPSWSFVMLIHEVVSSLLPAVSVLVTASFINTAIGILHQEVPTENIYPMLFALCAIVGYGWITEDIMKYVDSRIQIATRVKYRAEIIEKRAKLNYQYIENSEVYDLIKRVTDSSETQIKEQYSNALGLLNIVVSAASVMVILMVNAWWAGIVIIVFSIPLFYIGIKSGQRNYDAQRELTKVQRKAWYLNGILTNRETVEERTVFGYSNKINQMFWERFEGARKFKQKVEKKNYSRMKIGGGVVSIVSALIILVLLQPVASGTITVGLFISLVNATMGLAQTLSWELSWQLSQLTENREYLRDLTNFCQLEENEDSLELPLSPVPNFESLEFQNVTFSYPGTTKIILNKVTFKVEKGKHYSFVGANGTGKSTVTKLLTGQYNQYDGSIFINNKDIKEYGQSELKAMFGIVYQDFAKYSVTLKENIALGNVNNPSEKKIQEALELMNLDKDVAKLPKGIDTPLGKIQNDSVDLSGGQWQKVAMARCVINPAPIKILDEPTAALDPISESNIYRQFEKISRGSTAIFISHRLGSTKLADEIFVFQEGTVVERGNHEQLMKLQGIYKDMYTSQLEWYRSQEGGIIA